MTRAFSTQAKNDGAEQAVLAHLTAAAQTMCHPITALTLTGRILVTTLTDAVRLQPNAANGRIAASW